MIRKPKPFWYGLLWIGIAAGGYFLRGRVGTSGSGPAIQYWPGWAWFLLAVPGGLLVCAGFRPNSALGGLGQKIFDLFTWIQKQKKGH